MATIIEVERAMLYRDGFTISYKKRPELGYEGPETALCVDHKYYILIGNFLKQYEPCKTLGEALEVFRKNQEHKGSWSDELPPLVPADVINVLK